MLHRREVRANVKKAMAPKFVIARSEATWQSRSTESDHRKTIGEIVTAVPYQPPFRGTRHCRGGACPSRCCTNDSHRLSLKWQPPQTGPVAALSERPVGSNSTAGGHWCTSRAPDVSLRGAKRRGNLGKALPSRTSRRFVVPAIVGEGHAPPGAAPAGSAGQC